MKLFDTILRKHKSGLICSHDHLQKVMKARRECGYPNIETHINLYHPLIGQHLIYNKTGKRYTVKSSKKTWWWGWYHTLLLVDDNGSSVNIDWELNKILPCGDDMIIQHCKENQEDFDIL